MTLRLDHTDGSAVTVLADDAVLLRYVYAPTTPANESPRPYAHPVNTLAGDTLTNFRPNDHPWHHALSFTLNHVSGANFWGGPTCLPGTGYKWLDNHGAQHHEAWTTLEAAGATATLAHTLAWFGPRTSGVERVDLNALSASAALTSALGSTRSTSIPVTPSPAAARAETFFREARSLEISLPPETPEAWSLRWRSRLTNVSGRVLSLGNPHSFGGLAGSHYNGLQFRGARELLDDHLDPTIKVVADGGLEGIAAVHGALARGMEWHGQCDGTLRRVKIRFENNSGPLSWFVRRNYPLAAFPVQSDQNLELPVGGELAVDHTLTFQSPP